MSREVELAVGLLTATTLAAGLLGLAARFVLLPWLREHLVKPVMETNHQVTVNAHQSPAPTVLDKLDQLDAKVTLLAQMFDGHIETSGLDRQRLWDAVNHRHDH